MNRTLLRPPTSADSPRSLWRDLDLGMLTLIVAVITLANGGLVWLLGPVLGWWSLLGAIQPFVSLGFFLCVSVPAIQARPPYRLVNRIFLVAFGFFLFYLFKFSLAASYLGTEQFDSIISPLFPLEDFTRSFGGNLTVGAIYKFFDDVDSLTSLISATFSFIPYATYQAFQTFGQIDNVSLLVVFGVQYAMFLSLSVISALLFGFVPIGESGGGSTPKHSAAGSKPTSPLPVVPPTTASAPSTGKSLELMATQNLSIRIAQGSEWLPLNRMDDHWHWCQVTPAGFWVIRSHVSGATKFGIHVGTDNKTARACVAAARWARGTGMAAAPESTALFATAAKLSAMDGIPLITSGFNYIHEMQQTNDKGSFVGRFVKTIEDRENAQLMLDGSELFLTFFNPKDIRLGSNWDVVIVRVSANGE